MKNPHEKPAPQYFPKTQREVIEKYQQLGILDENLNPAQPPSLVKFLREDKPRPCSDCGREIVFAPRWNGNIARLDCYPEPAQKPGWLETSMGHFEPVFHHRCPGPPRPPKPARNPPATQPKPERNQTQPRRNRKRNPGQGDLL